MSKAIVGHKCRFFVLIFSIIRPAKPINLNILPAVITNKPETYQLFFF